MPYATPKQISEMISSVAFFFEPDSSAKTYGINFNSPVFSMHKYCWCEREDCPWCKGCTCPETSWTYSKDGLVIPAKTFHDEFYNYAGETPMAGSRNYNKRIKAWNDKIDERNKRYREDHTPTCDFCLGKSSDALIYGSQAGKGAPNFWYRPTDFKMWCYKHLSRGLEYNRKITTAELDEIYQACTNQAAK
jgi:hypothetical protein